MKLLSVISDICDDINGIPGEQLKDRVQPSKLQAAARKLYVNMATYANKDDIQNMARYYKNCLNSESGYDWLLESLGRKSLKSKWPRFQNIMNDL